MTPPCGNSGERKKLKEAGGNVFREVTIPCGIGIGAGITK